MNSLMLMKQKTMNLKVYWEYAMKICWNVSYWDIKHGNILFT